MAELMKRRSINKAELIDICKRQFESMSKCDDTLGPVSKFVERIRQSNKAGLVSWLKRWGSCEYSGEPINGQDIDFDHKIPNALLYEGDKVEWQVILRKWHKVKTADDVARIAKAKSQGGKESGQQSRRAKSKPKFRKIEDLSGQKFNRLFVTAFHGRRGGRAHWDCECDCGNIVTVRGSHLKSGQVKSCGCYRAERGRQMLYKHGHAVSGHETREYNSWSSMRERCSNPNHPSAKYYFEKGITFCESWNDFSVFLEDMGPRPEGCSLERLDGSLGYCKQNCVWADAKQQNRNTSFNRRLTYQGETRCVSEWAEILELPANTIFNRLRKGWSAIDALSTPKRKKRGGSSIQSRGFQPKPEGFEHKWPKRKFGQ